MFLDTAAAGGTGGGAMKTLVLIDDDALTRAVIAQCLTGRD